MIYNLKNKTGKSDIEYVKDGFGKMGAVQSCDDVVDVVRLRQKENGPIIRPIIVEFRSEYDKWTVMRMKAKLPGQNKNNLLLNPDNTTCTLFTPDPAEYTSNLDLTINNKALPMATHPKVLGLTLDPKLTYSTHIHNISVQAHKPLQIIKALTATGCGKQKRHSWLPIKQL